MKPAADRLHPVTMQFLERLTVETRGREMREVTAEIRRMLKGKSAGDGLATLFVRHTSASLTVQENADPDVKADLLDALDRLAPAHATYRHASEGPDDMPAHIKAVLTATSLAVPVLAGEPMLGTWQGIYLVEHRARPHRREIIVHFSGSAAPGRG